MNNGQNSYGDNEFDWTSVIKAWSFLSFLVNRAGNSFIELKIIDRPDENQGGFVLYRLQRTNNCSMYYTNDTVIFLNGSFVQASKAGVDPFSRHFTTAMACLRGCVLTNPFTEQNLQGPPAFRANETHLRNARCITQYSVEELANSAISCWKRMVLQRHISARWFIAARTYH